MTTATPQAVTDAAPTGWLRAAEKGSVLGIRLMIWVCTVFGRRPARLLVRLISLYYLVVHGTARRASRDFLARVHGHEPTLGDVYQHILRFAQVTLDRIFLLQGRHDLFSVTHTGHELLEGLHRDGKGAILLSAHIGSTSAMGIEGRAARLRINIVGYFKNARMINDVLRGVNPATAARVVSIERGSVNSVFTIRERIEAGEMLAIAGDRVGLNDRFVEVDFFGAKAAFPTGPFLLAAMLHCPVYFTLGLYYEPNRYELFCELFAESLDLPRKDRAAALTDCIQRYAARVEHFVRMAPDNWFNFYDFWSKH